MKLKLNVVIIKGDDGWCVAKCLENGANEAGKTVEEALANLENSIILLHKTNQLDIKNEETFFTTLTITL